MFGLFKSKSKDAARNAGETAAQTLIGKPADDPTSIAERHVVPVPAEELALTTRRVDGDTVRVNIATETELETATVELMRDAVSVERVPVDRPVASLPVTRTDGATTIIPVVRERLIVQKELVLVEEIHITHSRDSQTVSRDIEVRRQVPEVVRLSADRTAVEPAE